MEYDETKYKQFVEEIEELVAKWSLWLRVNPPSWVLSFPTGLRYTFISWVLSSTKADVLESDYVFLLRHDMNNIHALSFRNFLTST